MHMFININFFLITMDSAGPIEAHRGSHAPEGARARPAGTANSAARAYDGGSGDSPQQSFLYVWIASVTHHASPTRASPTRISTPTSTCTETYTHVDFGRVVVCERCRARQRPNSDET